LLPATLGISLVLALMLNLVACVELAQGAIVVPFAQDEALIHLELLTDDVRSVRFAVAGLSVAITSK
jgi:hypothetical protein